MTFSRAILATLVLACGSFWAMPAAAEAGTCNPQDSTTWQYCDVPASCQSPTTMSDPAQCQQDFADACNANKNVVPGAGTFAGMFCSQMGGFAYPPECSPVNGGQHPKACQTAAVAACKEFQGGGYPFQDQFCQTFFGTFPAPANGVPAPDPALWPVDGPCNPIDPASWGTCAPPPSCFNPGMGLNDPGQCQEDFAAMCAVYSEANGGFANAFCAGMATLPWPAECGFSDFMADQPACQAAMAAECKAFQGGGYPMQQEFCDAFFGGKVPNPGGVPGTENTAPNADLTADKSGGAGPLAVTFTVTAEDDDADDTLLGVGYSLDFGDGTAPATGSGSDTVSHTYANVAGTVTYTATLTVTDNHDAASTKSVTVAVSNTAPAATLGATPSSGEAPLEVAFSIGMNDANGDATTYQLDFGDGTTTAAGKSGTSESHSYAQGSWTATLTVTDAKGATGTATRTITVAAANQAPTAVLGGPSTGTVDEVLALNGDASSDPDGDALTYAWDFGDGATAAASSDSLAHHAYGAAGTYTVTLVVADGRGGTDSESQQVVIEDVPPPPTAIDAQLSSDYDADHSEIPLTVTFSAVGSTGPADATLDYTFVYGDGTQSGRLLTPTATHIYNAAGTYQPYVIVTDAPSGGSDGDESARLTIVATLSIVVTPGQQTEAHVSATPTSGTRPLTVSFDGSASLPASGKALSSYHFVFGDGAEATGTSPTVQHIYTVAGDFTATLTVTDSAGGSDSATVAISVEPGQPASAELLANPTGGTLPLTVDFDGSASSAGTGATLTSFDFDFGDGTTHATGASSIAHHIYTVAGDYSAKLTVTDSDGATATSTVVTIHVGAASQTNAQLRIVGPQTGPAPLTVTFDGSGSTAANGRTITSWAFDFDGNGTIDKTVTTASEAAAVSHTYTEAGTFQPKLTVTDSGASQSIASAKVLVQAPATVPQPQAGGGGGGALGFTLLLPFAGFGALRRRRR